MKMMTKILHVIDRRSCRHNRKIDITNFTEAQIAEVKKQYYLPEYNFFKII